MNIREKLKLKIFEIIRKNLKFCHFQEIFQNLQYFGGGLGNLEFLSKIWNNLEQFSNNLYPTTRKLQVFEKKRRFFFVLEKFTVQVPIGKTIDKESFTFTEDIATSPRSWSHSSELW